MKLDFAVAIGGICALLIASCGSPSVGDVGGGGGGVGGIGGGGSDGGSGGGGSDGGSGGGGSGGSEPECELEDGETFGYVAVSIDLPELLGELTYEVCGQVVQASDDAGPCPGGASAYLRVPAGSVVGTIRSSKDLMWKPSWTIKADECLEHEIVLEDTVSMIYALAIGEGPSHENVEFPVEVFMDGSVAGTFEQLYTEEALRDIVEFYGRVGPAYMKAGETGLMFVKPLNDAPHSFEYHAGKGSFWHTVRNVEQGSIWVVVGR